jgi:hypothetical protein
VDQQLTSAQLFLTDRSSSQWQLTLPAQPRALPNFLASCRGPAIPAEDAVYITATSLVLKLPVLGPFFPPQHCLKIFWNCEAATFLRINSGDPSLLLDAAGNLPPLLRLSWPKFFGATTFKLSVHVLLFTALRIVRAPPEVIVHL